MKLASWLLILLTLLASLVVAMLLLSKEGGCDRTPDDGDSDWQERANPLDPPLTTVCQRIDEIAAELHRRGLTARLEDVVIAFSPGFFPAEHWNAVDAGLRAALDV